MRQINLTLSLAFLAPQLVKAAVEGRLPRGINIERLRDPHAEWGRQLEELGLVDPDQKPSLRSLSALGYARSSPSEPRHLR